MSKTGTQLFGKYRAQVVDIKDPEKRGRVLVKSPKVLNNHQLGWAESCFMPGHFFLPRKNDWVWIEFEDGDVHKPIWVGIMPTRAYVRDYLLSQSSYPTTKSVVTNPNGDLNVSASELINNRSWDK